MLRNNEIQIQIETFSFSKPTDFLQKFQNFGKFSTFKKYLGTHLHGLKSLDIDTLAERVFYVEIICHGIHPIYYAFVST